MSKFLKIVSSENFISTTDKKIVANNIDQRIKNDQMDVASDFKKMDFKEIIGKSMQPQIIIANTLF